MTSRYGRPLELGISLVPNRADLELMRELAGRADELGLDVVGIQDHPYQGGDQLAQVERFAQEVVPAVRGTRG